MKPTLIVARNSPILTARALEGATIIAFAKGCSFRRILEAWLEACEIVPRRVLELASYHAIAACVAAGTGGRSCRFQPEADVANSHNFRSANDTVTKEGTSSFTLAQRRMLRAWGSPAIAR